MRRFSDFNHTPIFHPLKTRRFISKCILFIVAIQIINLSVYGNDMDYYPLHHHYEDIGTNSIDSAIEYVTEILLNYENAFPEYGKHQNSSSHTYQIKHSLFKQIDTFADIEIPKIISSVTYISSLNEDYKHLFFKEITPPPPKQLKA